MSDPSAADSSDAASLLEQGDSLLKEGRAEQALAAYERAIALEPDYPGFYVGKGFTLLAMKQFRRGLGACAYALLVLVKFVSRRFFPTHQALI